jgi:hypothetical protein
MASPAIESSEFTRRSVSGSGVDDLGVDDFGGDE